MRRVLLPLVLAFAMSGAAAMADGDPPPTPASTPADVVVLKDGRRIEGEIVGEDDRAVSVKSGGVTRTYMKDSIASVEKAPRAAPPADPSGKPVPAPPEAGKKKDKEKGAKRDAPLSDAAKKWLDELIAKSADAADDSVRRSIAQAIQALGPSAIPAVRAAQETAPEGPQKQFLERTASEMEQRRDRRDGPPGPEGMGPGARQAQARRGLEEMMQRLSNELELTTEQKPKVEAVLADSFKKRFELAGSARREGLSQEQMQQKIDALRADVLSQMKGVLTEPQYALFEAMAQKMFEIQRGGTPPKKPGDGEMPPPPEKPPEPAK